MTKARNIISFIVTVVKNRLTCMITPNLRMSTRSKVFSISWNCFIKARFFSTSWNYLFKACYSLLRQELQVRLPTRHAAYGQSCSRVHVAGRRAGTQRGIMKSGRRAGTMPCGIMKSCYLIHSRSYLFSFVFKGFKLAFLFVFNMGFWICIDLMRIRIQHFVQIRIQVSILNLIVI
jgi:hypothetical protein